MGLGGSFLDLSKCCNEGVLHSQTTNLKIFQGAQSLNTVKHVFRYALLTKRITFNSITGCWLRLHTTLRGFFSHKIYYAVTLLEKILLEVQPAVTEQALASRDNLP